jgi:two-component system chemotaxis response regulator CheB
VTTTQESQKKRLLALDDHPDSAELIARVATKCGYEARSIADPRALGNVLREWKPEVLTLDLCMPQEDGIAVLTTLKDAGFAGRVIIISGQDDWLRKSAGRLAEARGINVVEDVSKPVDLTMLRDLLMKLHTTH